MALHDEGVRFTEEMYATKEDIKNAYNLTMIDTIWDKIIAYRSNFYVDTGLINIDHNAFSLTLYSKLQGKISLLERKIFQIYVRYTKESQSVKAAFREQLTLRFFKEITYSDQKNISDDMLFHVIHRDISVFPANLAPLGFYQSALTYLDSHTTPLAVSTLGQINRLVGGEEINPTDSGFIFRREEIETSHYYQNNYIYKAAPIEELPELVSNMVDFLNNDNFSPLLKGIISTFIFDYLKPFDYQNEETSALLAKVVMAQNGFDEAGFFILTEGLSFDQSEDSKKVKKTVQETMDLTYYVIHCVKLIEVDTQFLNDLLTELETGLIEEERYLPEEKSIDEITPSNCISPLRAISKPEVRQFSSLPPLRTDLPDSLIGQSEVALPVFPSGIEKNAIESIVENLLEVYPYLKRTQAHFYANHCTIGKHYTIAQFRKEEEVAYETARTSMDFLADQGFYKKSQVRNKFVYTPIPRQ